MSEKTRHSVWVRFSHWLGAFSVIALMVSGWAILMTNPNLYWGEVGNPLVPAFIELPVSRNYQHEGWEEPVPFFESENSPVSAIRSYDILNLNSWGRSLHFLAAWVMVFTGLFYLLLGFVTRHFKRRLLPAAGEFSGSEIWSDIRQHARFKIPKAASGAPYSPLQKLTYCVLLIVVIPVIFLTGLTMSPAVTAAYPFLLDIFGGYQSARTIHFFAFVLVALFLVVHLLMVVLSGPGQQLRGMIFGSRKEDAQDAG